jgi:hypothetical protein
MASKKISIDFEKIWRSIVGYFNYAVDYFRNLTMDLIIAYAVLAVGVVALIIALCL